MPARTTPSYLNFDKAAYPWKSGIDYRARPKRYRVGKGEQGVLICEPYKSEIAPHWRFKMPAIAKRSARAIYKMFIAYLDDDDFVGAWRASFCRWAIRGRAATRTTRADGSTTRITITNCRSAGTGDPEKAESAAIFYEYWKKAESEKRYAAQKKAWKGSIGWSCPSCRSITISIVCLPKDALIKGGRSAGLTGIRTSWPKAKLVEYFLSRVPFNTAHEYCGVGEFIALGDTEPVEFLLYLYFGKTEDDLKNFALRDLGILRTNKDANLSARFTDGEEARACFHYSRLLDHLELKSGDVYRKAVVSILGGPPCTTDYAPELRSRAAHKAGLYFEKNDEKELATQLYRRGSSAECHERLVRLLYAAGDRDGAEELLRRMIDDPASDDEFVFASDFYARKFDGRRTGLCTELLRAGRTITVDDTWRGNPGWRLKIAARLIGANAHARIKMARKTPYRAAEQSVETRQVSASAEYL